ncbi:NAD-dependent epimerase/dehydratase family protein [Chitinophaga varians]|uniref:NAD-dependent epimerase/dehydratase family protein n=1 Tax=Chitinophaga varians TaxID=2202339 RepID=UPI00165FB861|nr:NAD(P)-dependent oxidoreductase [Chitinophaga varians]MBC9910291.1 NAD(P)-dependent oxidoreductase [Chitinophaga varians]
MRVLVTGSSGHLGEALVRRLLELRYEVVGIDQNAGVFTSHIGSITDADFVHERMKGVSVVFHAATLHKPHVVTHSVQQFIDTNITGTLRLLEAAVAAGVERFVFTSTTSVFGDAMEPAPGGPAVWVTPALAPMPKNIYGITKLAAEDLCRLFYRKHGLPCVVLRTSRFFPEIDDDRNKREAYDDANLKVNELLFGRVDLADVVTAHLLAAEKAASIGFDRYVISATTPFSREYMLALQHDAPAVLRHYYPGFEKLYARLNWKMQPVIDRVYDNAKARKDLGWKPEYDYGKALEALENGQHVFSPLAQQVGSKGYHNTVFTEGPYPVEK